MTAQIVTKFRNPIASEALETCAAHALATLARPIRRAATGDLWERASDVEKSETNRDGWFCGYYVYDRETRLPGVYDTHAEAVASIDKLGRLLGYKVISGLRFTKSGKAYRRA